MRGWYERLSVGRKQALWAWTFLAVPIFFYVTIRFYPTLQAFYISLTDWNLVGRMTFIGVDIQDFRERTQQWTIQDDT